MGNIGQWSGGRVHGCCGGWMEYGPFLGWVVQDQGKWKEVQVIAFYCMGQNSRTQERSEVVKTQETFSFYEYSFVDSRIAYKVK